MAKRRKSTISVALMFPTWLSHLEKAMHGITDFARQHGGWTFVVRPESYTFSLRSLREWNGDGVIALVDTEAEAAAARELDVPVVNLSGSLRDAGLPRVMADNEALGRLAAEHLLQCGFRRFAYYGLRNLWYAELRQTGFVERIRREGHDCAVLNVESDLGDARPWFHGQQPLERWLDTLTTPVGLLASNDHRARMVSEACSRLELKVPDSVGIVGVDNQEVICEFCVPPLSSVSRNDYEVGFEAASLLNRIMAGETPPEKDVVLPPDGVIRRHSTDIVGVDDPNVAAAVRYIRENLDKQFGVKQITAHTSVSRRFLEQGFRTQLGCTPYEYLSRLRVQRAMQLLSGENRPKISHVARACGFNNPLQLRRAFYRETGTTPQRYRKTI
jgi:LacI family transcriptional regulator